jgi:hypothetical protein
MFLVPDQLPGATLVGERDVTTTAVVFAETALRVVGIADVKTASSILQDVDPELAAGRFQNSPVVTSFIKVLCARIAC